MGKINTRKERVYLLADLARMKDRNGLHVLPNKPKYSTLYKYTEYGSKNQSGVFVFLEWVPLPGQRRATTIEAYHRFLEALNG